MKKIRRVFVDMRKSGVDIPPSLAHRLAYVWDTTPDCVEFDAMETWSGLLRDKPPPIRLLEEHYAQRSAR